jgi:hypothetical protein
MASNAIMPSALSKVKLMSLSLSLTHTHTQSKHVDCAWNVMAHAQKLDFVFRRKGQVHLNRQGRQFSRLLAAEVCTLVCWVCTARASLFCSHVTLTGYPIHSLVSPSRLRPCVTVCHHISTGLHHNHAATFTVLDSFMLWDAQGTVREIQGGSGEKVNILGGDQYVIVRKKS